MLGWFRISRLLAVLALGIFLALVTAASSTTPAAAQILRPAATAPAVAVVEEEAPDSPRASMRAFLDLSLRGRYDEAALYLDTPRGRENNAAELAHKLYDVLSQRLLVDPEQLSPLAAGKKDDNLPAGVEELGKIKDARGHALPIRIVRHESRAPEDEARWLFSQNTLVQVDGLHAALRNRWIRELLPQPLLRQGPKALYYWQWIALPLLALACIALGRMLTWLSGAAAQRVLARFSWSPRLLLGLRAPVTFGWALLAFWLVLPQIALTLRAEDLLLRVLRALGYLVFFWALLRAVGVAGDEVSEAAWAKTRPSVRSLTGVGVRLGKVVVGALALMFAFSELGYPVTSIIAGLGIGGVVLALAAQKTVENLFGSVSILADQAFRVGDIIRVDTIEGTVESIGVRSTRVRTADRTVIIFPNGKLADMRIESLGPRDIIRFATKLQISRDATRAQLDAVAAGVRTELEKHPAVRKAEVSVRLIAFGDSSFDFEVTAPVETLDATRFAVVREELLLSIVDVVEQAGTRLALPTRHIVATTAGGAGH